MDRPPVNLTGWRSLPSELWARVQPRTHVLRVAHNNGPVEYMRVYTMEAVCESGEWLTLSGMGSRQFDTNNFKVREEDAAKLLAEQQPAEKPSNPKDALGSGKIYFSVVPPIVLSEVSLGMLDGATKYGRYNWRANGVRGSIYYDATLRHLTAWWEGQDIDPDSGLHHVTKAITSLIVLRDAMIQGKYTDDRPPSTADLQTRLDDLNGKTATMVRSRETMLPQHCTINSDIPKD